MDWRGQTRMVAAVCVEDEPDWYIGVLDDEAVCGRVV